MNSFVQESFWVPKAVALVCIGVVDPRLFALKTIASAKFAFHAMFHVTSCAVVGSIIPLLKLDTLYQIYTGVIRCFQKLVRLLSFCHGEVTGAVRIQTLGVPQNESVLALKAMPIIHSAPCAVRATIKTVVLPVIVLSRLANFEPLTFATHQQVAWLADTVIHRFVQDPIIFVWTLDTLSCEVQTF